MAVPKYSLKILLLFMLVAGAALGSYLRARQIASNEAIELDRERRNVLAEVEKRGGCQYHDHLDGTYGFTMLADKFSDEEVYRIRELFPRSEWMFYENEREPTVEQETASPEH